jgi:hypothetical protein
MRLALDEMKERYDVPPGLPAPREGVDPMQYYSSERTLIEPGKGN